MTITIDPKTGYSPELKARVEAEIARARTFEPLAAADPDADLAWLVSDKDDVDVGYRFETPPPDLDFVWPGFLAGSVGALVAPGATGKSFWALEAMMSIACSVAGGDLAGLNPEKSGRCSTSRQKIQGRCLSTEYTQSGRIWASRREVLSPRICKSSPAWARALTSWTTGT